MKILLVEDNEKMSKYVVLALKEEGYSVDTAFDGETAYRIIKNGTYDLVVLDIMLPKKDGISVCKDLRDTGCLVPIIMLTAKQELEDRIIGLDSGADDYMMKPFEIKELFARIRALLRRPEKYVDSDLMVQDLVLHINTRTLIQSGKEIPLTVKEYSILEYLMRNNDIVVTREKLLEHCWDFAYSSFSNITDVYIKQIRKKLNDTDEKYIKTIRGVGYKCNS